jgi:hypothetical protein
MSSALIVTGPLDGTLTDHPGDVLDVPNFTPKKVKATDLTVCDEPLPIEKLTFARVTYKFPFSFTYVALFVPVEWTTNEDRLFVERMILGHLLKKEFEGATGNRQDGQG